MQDKKVILNEKEVSQDELEEKKKQVEEMKDAELVEVEKDNYKIRMLD